MSIPEDFSYEMKVNKPKVDTGLLGALVYAVNDEKKRTMTLTGFLPIGSYEDNSADVVCTWISSQGKPKSEDFKIKEIEIIKK